MATSFYKKGYARSSTGSLLTNERRHSLLYLQGSNVPKYSRTTQQIQTAARQHGICGGSKNEIWSGLPALEYLKNATENSELHGTIKKFHLKASNNRKQSDTRISDDIDIEQEHSPN